MTPDATTALAQLRGDPDDRPARDEATAARLRELADLHLAEAVATRGVATPVVLSASSLYAAPGTADLMGSARARLRGALVSTLVRLRAVGQGLDDAFGDAVAAWRADSPAPDLVDHLLGLDADERARLGADVAAHDVALTRGLGKVAPGWAARPGARASVRVAQGRVVLRDSVDLSLGSSADERASVVLLDVTTAPLGEGARRALRYHALVEALRSGVVPWRSAAL
ncbi:MAG TPA: hypothetical protein VGS61_01995, partial [Acidimicrobiales bacterium]|nr:hypothetical protein [Acidimicrobiales bacterium]